jgi:hypothetical protein
VYWNDSPGFKLGLNLPSKNWVAQCGLRFGLVGNVAVPGLRKVTVVPTDTVRVEGTIAPVDVLSAVAVAVPFERASRMVLAGTSVLAAVLPMARIVSGGASVPGCAQTTAPAVLVER